MPQFSLRTLAIFTAVLCGSLAAVRFPTPGAIRALELAWPALLIIAACLAIGCRGAFRSLFLGFLIATVGAYYWDNPDRASVRTIPTFSRALAENLERYLLNGYVPAYDGLTTFSLESNDAQRVHFIKKDKEGNVVDEGFLPLWRVQGFGISKTVLPVRPDRESYFEVFKLLMIVWIGLTGAAIAYYADKASQRRGKKPPRKEKDPPEETGLD
ncbi:hypothetical protein LOC68_16690 [Blastopirellula sp. JC732]|uniref:Uncharacterized protein n=1 Tax=Blastopirellula sediminis TaxID=2894196 RepID=A0A9X1MNX4_9BACT|nr:hypothetical protein [Blastopirellula sediminis]MCC9606672.1 hypothetical protein [Blastopirellula sediminis]MCC9630031.1 hypothetical protein [Blastopirellula sediminis]